MLVLLQRKAINPEPMQLLESCSRERKHNNNYLVLKKRILSENWSDGKFLQIGKLYDAANGTRLEYKTSKQKSFVQTKVSSTMEKEQQLFQEQIKHSIDFFS